MSQIATTSKPDRCGRCEQPLDEHAVMVVTKQYSTKRHYICPKPMCIDE